MKVLVLPGDGIGKEVTAQAVKVLKAAIDGSNAFELTEAPIGGAGLDSADDPLPPATLDLARKADPSCSGLPEFGDELLLTRAGRARACCGCARRLACSRTSGPSSCSRS
jgi:hypothetical protein